VRANLKLLQTTSFRLSAIYLLFFAVSTAALLTYVYYNTSGLLERQTEDTIRAEVLGLADQYHERGIGGVMEVINRRIIDGDSIYRLQGPAGETLAGNLATMPGVHLADELWFDFPITVGKGTATSLHTVRAYHVELAGEYELLVGRDVQDIRKFGDIIKTALYWALGFSLVMGLSGGLMMSRNFLARIDAITEASHGIMAGQLSGRMPVTGSGDEIDRLSASLNDMLSQIERLMQGMREVSSNVAHDMRSPLTRLRARVEAALRSGQKKEYEEALQSTIGECDSLLKTFNALLSIAQAEAGQSRTDLEVLNAEEILYDVAELYGPVLEDAGGTLTLDVARDLQVKGSRQLLAQVVNNLIDNALKYGADEKSGKVDLIVRGQRVGNWVEISVIDHGQGIAEADRERVLQRFVRLDNSRTKPGNGLGLSLVASVMTMLGGNLLLKDNNPGLVAVLRLPSQSPVV
jgi:signal transduction histidine kinase